MTATYQIKLLDRKIMQNEAEYDLDRKAAKISALSSNNLDKYEYLTGKDLGLRSSAVEQAKFEYSPLGRFFNKELIEEEKKEGLLKRLKNIEDKNDEQLKIIGNKTGIKSQIDLSDEDLTLEAIALIKEIKSIEDSVDYDKLSFTGGNKKIYGLDSFMTLEKLIKDILSKNTTIDRAEIKQNRCAEKLDELRDYPARMFKYIDLKDSVSKNVKNFYDGGEKIVYGFKNRILPLSKNDDMKTDSADSQLDILGTTEQKRFNDFLTQIKEEQKNIDMISFEKYFSYRKPDEMVQDLFDSKSKLDNHDKLVLIHESFDNAADKANKLPPSTNKHEFVKILKIVNKILAFNEQIQKGQGLKILTPNQMLSRLPIASAQLKAGNNSQKLKNEIRQLLYSLYRSKKLTKQIYKSLIDIV